MKINIDENGMIVLEEIVKRVVLKTSKGNEIGVFMYDNTVEMTVIGSDRHYKANMQTGEIEEI